MSDTMNAEIENGSVEENKPGAVTEDKVSGEVGDGEEAAATGAPIPTKEQMEAMIKAQGQIINAGQCMSHLTQNAVNMLDGMTMNNPRMAFAIANELALIYGEALRSSVQVNHIAPPVSGEVKTEEKSAA